MSWHPIIRALAAASFLIVHTALAGLFIVCVYAIEALIRLLWQTGDPTLFGRLPLAYFFMRLISVC